MTRFVIATVIFFFGNVHVVNAAQWCLVHDMNGKKMGCYSSKSVCEQVKPKQYWSCVAY